MMSSIFIYSIEIMNKIRIEWKDVYRELWFKLSLNAEISYEEFCKNKKYDSIVDKNTLCWNCYRAMTWRWFYSLWEIKWLEKYEDLYTLFLEYNYIEKFENLLDLPLFTDNVSVENNEILYKKHTGEVIKDDDTINFYIEDIKYHLNKNRYFNNQDMYDNLKNPKLVTPFRNYTIQTNSSDEELYDLKKSIKNCVKLTQIREKNRILDYLYFLSITTTLKLFIMINPSDNSFIIVDEINISSLKNSYSLCIYITPQILFTLTQQSQELIEQIKTLHTSEKQGDSKKIFEDLYEIIKKNPTSKITINSNQYGNNVNLDFLIRDQNINNFEKIKNYKRWERWVTRSTSLEEHGTKKTAVVSHGKIKYNNDLDNIQ